MNNKIGFKNMTKQQLSEYSAQCKKNKAERERKVIVEDLKHGFTWDNISEFI